MPHPTDAWHAAAAFSANTGQRYMLKFQAARMAPPDGPSWAHDPAYAAWEPPPGPNQAIIRDVWMWLRGKRGNNTQHQGGAAVVAGGGAAQSTTQTSAHYQSFSAAAAAEHRVDRQGNELRGFKLADEATDLSRALSIAAAGDPKSGRVLCQALCQAGDESEPTIFELTPSNAHGINPVRWAVLKHASYFQDRPQYSISSRLATAIHIIFSCCCNSVLWSDCAVSEWCVWRRVLPIPPTPF